MADVIDQGGYAFPIQSFMDPAGNLVWPQEGMTLRDWLAGQALAGIIGAVTTAHLHSTAQTPGDEVIAVWSYSVADAMIEARKATSAT